MQLWDAASFSEIFDILSNNTLSRAELDTSGKIQNIHYGDILVKYGDVVNVSNVEIPYVKDDEKIKKPCFLCNGDIIIADTAEDEMVGKAIEITGIVDEKVVSGLHTIPCRPTTQFASGYLGHYLNSSAYHNQIVSLMQGIKVYSISKTNIAKTQIRYPNISIQKKIAVLLDCIDKRILLQQALINAVKSYKRGLLRRIFNSMNSDWKEYKLSDIAKIYQPQTIASTDLIKDGAYPVYGANGCIGRYDRYNHDTEQIAICCRGASCGTVNHIPAFSWITGNAMVINIHSNIADKIFVYYCLLATDLSYMVSGSGQPQIVREPCANHKIHLPNMQTQHHIAELFSTLDKNIDAHIRTLQNLEAIKQALLQNLFI